MMSTRAAAAIVILSALACCCGGGDNGPRTVTITRRIRKPWRQRQVLQVPLA